MTIDDILAEHSMNRSQVEAHEARMLAGVHAYQLRGLHENTGSTRVQLTERAGVGQRQVSKTEYGDLDAVKIGTIRRYLEAAGGSLSLEYVAGDLKVMIN